MDRRHHLTVSRHFPFVQCLGPIVPEQSRDGSIGEEFASRLTIGTVVHFVFRVHDPLLDGGDHSFKVLKRSGRTVDEVFDELTDTIQRWIDGIT